MTPPAILGQGEDVRRNGVEGGAQGPGAGPTRSPRRTRGQGSPLPLVAHLRALFWLRGLFTEIMTYLFSWNFWGFGGQVS